MNDSVVVLCKILAQCSVLESGNNFVELRFLLSLVVSIYDIKLLYYIFFRLCVGFVCNFLSYIQGLVCLMVYFYVSALILCLFLRSHICVHRDYYVDFP